MNSLDDSTFIPFRLYHQITKLMPIASVEAVIVIKNALLLLRRKNSPGKGNGGSLAAEYIRENRSIKLSIGKLMRKRFRNQLLKINQC